MRLYASTVTTASSGALSGKRTGGPLTQLQANHGELVRRAQEFGIDPSRSAAALHRSTSATRRRSTVSAEKAWRRSMREVADLVDDVAAKLEDLASGREARSGSRLRCVSRSRIRVDCGNCNEIKAGMDNAGVLMDVACGVAVLFPLRPASAACRAAVAAFLVMRGVVFRLPGYRAALRGLLQH